MNRKKNNLGLKLNVGDKFRIAGNAYNQVKDMHVGCWMTIVEIKGYPGDTLPDTPRYIAKWDYERNHGRRIGHEYFINMYWLDRDWDECICAMPEFLAERKELPNV